MLQLPPSVTDSTYLTQLPDYLDASLPAKQNQDKLLTTLPTSSPTLTFLSSSFEGDILESETEEFYCHNSF
jgi:hypothetical protein